MAKRLLELRASPREKMRRSGWILCAASASPIPCVVWDLSRTGARLAAARPELLPSGFKLRLVTGNLERFCRVVWRRDSSLGVAFVSAAEAKQAAETTPDDRVQGMYLRDPYQERRRPRS